MERTESILLGMIMVLLTLVLAFAIGFYYNIDHISISESHPEDVRVISVNRNHEYYAGSGVVSVYRKDGTIYVELQD